MSLIQRLILRLVPKALGARIKADSQAWQIRCIGCNAARSIWDCGGIRYRAASAGKRTLVRCSNCGGLRRAAVERAPEKR